ncbi:hypothetical protein PFISCL1PPCAC_26815, partial [Pristionchus fissidentatus]
FMIRFAETVRQPSILYHGFDCILSHNQLSDELQSALSNYRDLHFEQLELLSDKLLKMLVYRLRLRCTGSWTVTLF